MLCDWIGSEIISPSCFVTSHFRGLVVFAVFAFSPFSRFRCFRRFRVFAFSPFSRFSRFRVFVFSLWHGAFSRFLVFGSLAYLRFASFSRFSRFRVFSVFAFSPILPRRSRHTNRNPSESSRPIYYVTYMYKQWDPCQSAYRTLISSLFRPPAATQISSPFFAKASIHYQGNQKQIFLHFS